MSGPYDNSGYPQQPQYGGNNYQQQGYQQQGGYGAQEFGAPQRRDSYGPPQHGGFQHGQQGGQYGAYDASNPQGHPGYYGDYNQQQQPQYNQHQQQQQYGQPQQHNQQGYGAPAGGNDAWAQNQAYQQSLQHGGPAAQPNAAEHQFAKQSSDPQAPNYDPSAPPMTEQDRGLLGALGGGFAGHHFGGKAGHGILGTIGGAIAGSFAEDFFKDKKKNKHSGGSSYGGSSWGGGSKW